MIIIMIMIFNPYQIYHGFDKHQVFLVALVQSIDTGVCIQKTIGVQKGYFWIFFILAELICTDKNTYKIESPHQRIVY